MTVPTVRSLGDMYSADAVASQTTRWNGLLAKFKSTYGRKPDFVARSPGRVNLIGEVHAQGSSVRSQLTLPAHRLLAV